ncbi:hypothetical protein [Paracraurococcus lichenis]|uniref:Uncharacterized protein n=1 Tax=Paracraurococcus lichenis TaxID=3064888 RepID=A0ABT9DV64_9PROT|nr:hypothetical protein [Paracraurococcus sp. LOR1-02]MDO9707784.1 hypothetical protein [Paracraurococcus sp. LOR1-02]
MDRLGHRPFVPGASVLGGAACGLSYEGLLRDAMAEEERDRRREAGRSRALPRPPVAAQRPEADRSEQSRVAGR